MERNGPTCPTAEPTLTELKSRIEHALRQAHELNHVAEELGNILMCDINYVYREPCETKSTEAKPPNLLPDMLDEMNQLTTVSEETVGKLYTLKRRFRGEEPKQQSATTARLR